MAMVAATVASGGIVMRPYVVGKIVAPNGSVVYRAKPDPLGRAIKPKTAKELNEFMQLVVTGGTGTAAQIPGIKVAGKTGTAETNVIGRNTTWFVGFAPADKPRGRVRGRAREPDRLRRHHRGADREADPAGPPTLGRETVTSTPMVVSDPLPNSVFDGRYLIIRKLGTGGMANVYLAEDQELGRRVAIKILDDRHAQDAQFVERFRREATNAAGLSHPNIVSIYDRGEAEGTYYIAMEYLDGRTLKELILRRGPAPVKTAIDYTRQILAALRFAHKNGIVHRDIKPHNVLVDSEGRLKVTDFGIARAGASQMTEAGSIIGTAQYLSPEQAKGAPVDQTSDIYSIGIVLYELLTGTVPYTGDTPVEIAMKHLSQVPEPPSALEPQIPHELDAIVLRSLAKDPADRYQSADEMDADLERAAGGLPIAPATEEAATMVLSPPTRPRRSAAGAAASLDRPATTSRRAGAARSGRGCSRSCWSRPRWSAGWYVYMQLQDQLKSNQPVAVENYVGLHESLAVGKILERGLTPHVVAQGERGAAGDDRLPAGSRARQPDRQGQHGHDLRLDREAEGGGARRARQELGRCGPGAGGRRVEVEAVDRAVEPADRDRGRAGSEGRQEGRGGHHRARQRREGADAGRRAARRRRAVRPGGRAAPGAGLRGRAQGRRLEPARRAR